MKNPNRFYVYILFRPDGSPCYVGKGSGRRWLNHETMSRKSYYPNKALAEIIALAPEGLPKVKIRSGLLEREALDIERAFIEAIGRIPNGPLVNGIVGGFVDSPNRGKNISAAKKGKPAHPNVGLAASSFHAGRRKPDSQKAAISSTNKIRWEKLKSSPDLYEKYLSNVKEGWRKRRAGNIQPE